MAQGDEIQRTSDTPHGQRVQNSLHLGSSKDPTFLQLLQRDGSKWSKISSQIKKQNHDQHGDGNRHSKKSMLTKVKETAKRLKISLSGKKRHDKNETQCRSPTRSSSVGPKDKGEEDAEYHSARMYESKHTSATNKQTSVSIPEKHLEKTNARQSKDEPASSSKRIAEAHSKNHAPLDTSTGAADTNTRNQTAVTTDVPKVGELPESNLRFSGLTVSTQESVASKANRSIHEGQNMKGEPQTWDKGVSVKEYLMHKFEPGEDERALSKVITQTICPRREKMREAMSSFLKNEEPSEVNSSNVDNNVNVNFKSKSLPASTNLNANTGSKIAYIKQSYSLGSNTSKASSKLNQTFRSTFASYQDHFVGPSSNHNAVLNSSATSSSPNTNPGSNQSLTHLHSPMKTSSSPLGHACRSNETQAPAQDCKTRIPSHTATSVRRVHVSRANQTRVPSHNETNNIQVPLSTANQADANATRPPVSTGD